MAIRTRFAPSPTGLLHVGGVRTALYNYLLAKQSSGSFILRLEDTDRERFVPRGVEQIVEGLDWMGLKPDEGFWISEGQHQNIDYVQSERHKSGLYRKYAQQLLEQGLVYYSPTSPEELEKFRIAALEAKQPFIYRRSLDKRNSNQPVKSAPLRLDTEAIKQKFSDRVDAVWRDELRGEMPLNLQGIEDFILIKGDGFPTYNFANVIDDYEMKISHVLRGDEFLASASKHTLLYQVFGWQAPKFIHLPVINGPDGKKLSKRTGDTDVLEYRQKGYLPEALINFLALLGWNDGTEQEIFSLDELIKKFSLDGLNTSPAVFDQKRLDWMNGHYIRELSIDKLHELTEAKSNKQKAKNSFWPESAKKYPGYYKKAVLKTVQERLKYLAELAGLTNLFFEDLPANLALIDENKQLNKLDRAQQIELLKKAVDKLEQSNFSAADLTAKLNILLEETHQKPVVLFSLIRIATTWAPASPALAETLAVLGKERTLERLGAAIAALAK